ncbi:DUF5996 family protein [Sphingomonas sp. PAMC 26617]|uniref:DUF5996 family protein n=1 Tax=Sphingomonas sp. PAMC 26617 TaxID=1112216 RepID=UPI000289E4EE|nr:DUF5996 family protein [Sphingomonas sp. PAMC 26617]
MRSAILNPWPDLANIDLRRTTDTLHLWCQIVGKVRFAKTPWVDHTWHVPLYVSARGLSTGLVPDGARAFEIEFDFIAEALVLRGTDGREGRVPLRLGSVADFYQMVMLALGELDVVVTITPTPCELSDAVPFARDEVARPFDPAVARTYWRALIQVERVFQVFRTRFQGKCSPIHLFWGSFDLAVTRFSGRPATVHPGGFPHLSDAVVRDAYSREQAGVGFWPGSGEMAEPSFYAEAYPVPAAYAAGSVAPADARYDPALREFVLPYSTVRAAADPDGDLLQFLQSTYEAVAVPDRWDRQALEGPQGPVGRSPSF